MIELQSDELSFAFPELLEQLRSRIRVWVDERLECASEDAKDRLPSAREEIHRTFAACLPRISAAVSFQRTLRLPDNGKNYPMPLGLGRFEIYPVDEFAGVPEPWRERGGVMLPLHKTEAVWLNFFADYPMALRVGMGGVCAVSGEPWGGTLKATPQNYLVLGHQPWLDGLHARPEVVRQFVARPQGRGLMSAHALSGEERWGGLQLQAFPLRAEEFWRQVLRGKLDDRWDELMTPIRNRQADLAPKPAEPSTWTVKTGGQLRLKIMDDLYGVETWDTAHSSRCFAHLCLAEDWQRLTGIRTPQRPPTAADYQAAGVSWADLEEGKSAADSDSILADVIAASAPGSRPPLASSASRSPLAPRSILRLNPDLRQLVREF
ncbi:MAG: hypothetical protein ABI222_17990 [Opitutaceae bacterium]